MSGVKEKTTLVLFSGEYDKATAAMIIANGAAAYDHDVTLFFTFWGLNALRKDADQVIKKPILERLFGWMMPKGAEKLPLSRMNFGGLGQKMIKSVMKKHNALSLPQLMELAKEQGIKLVACQMTMDLLGIRREELIDGVEFAGVGAYLADASDGKVNLFI